MRRFWRGTIRAGVSPALGAVWLLRLAAPAAAHADLIDANPRPGVGLAQAPTEVVIRFSEPLNLSLSSLDVVDERGVDIGDGPTLPVEGDRQAMRRRLGLLEPGRYTVRWASVSPLSTGTPSATATSSASARRPACLCVISYTV